MLVETILDQLRQLAQQAEKAFDSSCYGQSACQLHKQDQVSNRLKYCEDRDVVVRRILKIAQQQDDPEVVKRALDEIETKNTGIKQSLVLTSADW